MLALHIECLTRRYLLHRINLVEGLLGLNLGILCALEGRGKLRLSRLRAKLQRLVLHHESLELLLHLARGMWNLFCRVGHYPCIQNSSVMYSEEEPALQC